MSVRANTPVFCAGCRAISGPRPLGQCPLGWTRDEDDLGAYWCPECMTGDLDPSDSDAESREDA